MENLPVFQIDRADDLSYKFTVNDDPEGREWILLRIQAQIGDSLNIAFSSEDEVIRFISTLLRHYTDDTVG